MPIHWAAREKMSAISRILELDAGFSIDAGAPNRLGQLARIEAFGSASCSSLPNRPDHR
jgi:hypothetical protein